MEEFNIVFKFDKATKGAYRYREDQDPTTSVVGNLYMRKWAFTDEPPDEINVTISGGSDDTATS
jgi:hypothetical protein